MKDDEKIEHGHWEHYCEGGIRYIRCSICGEIHAMGDESVRIHEEDWTCPKCGAVMDEDIE